MMVLLVYIVVVYTPEAHRVSYLSFDIEVCRLLCSILSCILGNNVCKVEPFPHTA